MKYFVAMFVAALCALTPSPAYGADEIGLSYDGATWADSLPRPLFDPDFRWVPGDDETATFYVRNQGPTRAYLTLTARSADRDELLANEDMDLRARADGGEWIDLQNGEPTTDLTPARIARGGVVRVDVNVRFDFASPNESQLDTLRALFDVTLSQDPTDGGNGDGDDGDGDGNGNGAPPTESNGNGLLPSTGGPSMLILVAASLSLGAGLALMRRSRADESETTAGQR